LVGAAGAESVAGCGVGDESLALLAGPLVVGAAVRAVVEAGVVVDVGGVAVFAATDAGCPGFLAGLDV
jgi:hypothetical protein